MRGARFWIRVAQCAAALMVVAAGIFALWYRGTYNVWPGQQASTRIHWCGRDYESFAGTPQTRQQISSREHFPDSAGGPVSAAGLVPPEAVRRGRHRSPAAICQPAATLRDGGLPAHRPRSVSGVQPRRRPVTAWADQPVGHAAVQHCLWFGDEEAATGEHGSATCDPRAIARGRPRSRLELQYSPEWAPRSGREDQQLELPAASREPV